MLFILNQVYRFLRLLHSDTTPSQVAGGLALGLFLGLTPFNTLHGVIALSCVFLLRVQIVVTLLSAACFALIATIATPWFHALGMIFLRDIPVLRPLYATLSDQPLVPFTRFYNSVVMGSAVVSTIVVPSTFVVTWIFLKRYWAPLETVFFNSRLWDWWQQSPPYLWYENYETLTLDDLRAQRTQQPTPENTDAPPP